MAVQVQRPHDSSSKIIISFGSHQRTLGFVPFLESENNHLPKKALPKPGMCRSPALPQRACAAERTCRSPALPKPTSLAAKVLDFTVLRSAKRCKDFLSSQHSKRWNRHFCFKVEHEVAGQRPRCGGLRDAAEAPDLLMLLKRLLVEVA